MKKSIFLATTLFALFSMVGCDIPLNIPGGPVKPSTPEEPDNKLPYDIAPDEYIQTYNQIVDMTKSIGEDYGTGSLRWTFYEHPTDTSYTTSYKCYFLYNDDILFLHTDLQRLSNLDSMMIKLPNPLKYYSKKYECGFFQFDSSEYFFEGSLNPKEYSKVKNTITLKAEDSNVSKDIFDNALITANELLTYGLNVVEEHTVYSVESLGFTSYLKTA